MKYNISHTTRYQYGESASLSHNELYLTPRDTPVQTCVGEKITLFPLPSSRARHKDFFGNTVTSTTIDIPHTLLEITAVSEIVLSAPQTIQADQTPAWEKVKEMLRKHATVEALDAFQYVFASPMVPVDDRFVQWTRDLFLPGTPILSAATALMHKIFTEFTYDSQATTTNTPVETSFDIKRGVCQDFAHIQIACFRSLGLSARYISGYLHTQPPPGKQKLTGADASHAWVSIYIPGMGWVDLDPTNDVIPTDQHLTLAWGRDYTDVTPVKGTVLGGGQHHLSVVVDVVANR
jgi:transglutaminase-like putative cysteine protease